MSDATAIKQTRVRIVGADKSVGFLHHAVKMIADPKETLHLRNPRSDKYVTIIHIPDRSVRRLEVSTVDLVKFEWGSCLDSMTLRQLRLFGEVTTKTELYVVVDEKRRISVYLGRPDTTDIPLIPDLIFTPYFVWSVIASLFSSPETINETLPTYKHDAPPDDLRYWDQFKVTDTTTEGVTYWDYLLCYMDDTRATQNVSLVRKASTSDSNVGIYIDRIRPC